MTDIATALQELGITEWVLRGEPTTEAEWLNMFRKVTGSDDNGSAIESSNPSDFGTTWSAVSAKKTELVNAEPMRLLREERDSCAAPVHVGCGGKLHAPSLEVEGLGARWTQHQCWRKHLE